MCPAIDSEFSNPFMMALNTLIAGYVQGIPDKQIKSFILYCRLNAKAESRLGDASLHETEIYKVFSRLLAKAGLEGDLFNFSWEDGNAVKKLKMALRDNDRDIMHLVSGFINQEVLQKKEPFSEEIATNGVNVDDDG